MSGNSAPFMSVARRLRAVAAFLLLVLFALTAVLTILLWAAETTWTDAATYRTILGDPSLVERGPTLIADVFVAYLHPERLGIVEDHSLQTWEAVAKALLPGGWVAGTLQSTADAVVVWLDQPEEAVPALIVDLTPVIQRLQDPNAALGVLPLLQNLPLCADGIDQALVAQDGVISCLPRGVNLTTVAQEAAATWARLLPTQWSLPAMVAEGTVPDTVVTSLEQLRLARRALTNTINLGLRASLLFLTLFALLYAKDPRQVLHRLPRPLLAAGGLSLLLLLLLQLYVALGLEATIVVVFPHLGGTAQAIAVDLARDLMLAARGRWLASGLVLFGLGLALALLNNALARRQARSERAAPQEQPRTRIRRQFR